VGDSATPETRIGLGHDTHRLAPGGPLRLGGLDIPHDHHAVGHSDADALLHAVTDALLGAAALGDIGDWFPDTDPENRNRDSADMLSRAWQGVREQGYKLLNVDCVVFAQRPKLSEYKLAIRQRVAELLEVDAAQVSVKAKTGEGIGAIGQQEAIATECIVLIQQETK